jgi:hypothetical protein
MDTEDWQLNPRLFAHLQARWGPHTLDRFASMLNTATLSSHGSTLDGATHSAMISIAYTCPTQLGSARTITATLLGQRYLLLPLN